MSRTTVHDPYWVKKLSPEWRRYFVEIHHHETRDCNFTPTNDFPDCYLSWRSMGRNIHCGCRMCTNQIGRRQNRRSTRYLAKKILRSGQWEKDIPKHGAHW